MGRSILWRLQPSALGGHRGEGAKDWMTVLTERATVFRDAPRARSLDAGIALTELALEVDRERTIHLLRSHTRTAWLR